MYYSNCYSNHYSCDDDSLADFISKLCILVVYAGLFVYSPLWTSLSLTLGVFTIAFRIYITGKNSGTGHWDAYVYSEIMAGWKTGFIFWAIFVFWPFMLVWLYVQRFFRSSPMAFSRHFELDRFNEYTSRREYHGIHIDTARELSESAVKELQRNGKNMALAVKELPEAIEHKSRLALAIASVLTFLAAPFSFVRTQEKSENRIYGQTIFNLVDFNFNWAIIGVEGTKGSVRYVSDIDLTLNPKLNQAFVSYSLGNNIDVSAGQQYTPIPGVPPSPDGSFAHAPLIARDVDITLRGVMVAYTGSDFYSKFMVAQNPRIRFSFVSSKTFDPFKIIMSFEKNHSFERVVFQTSLKKGFVNVIAGIAPFSSDTYNGTYFYAVCIARPMTFLELAANYDRHPILSSGERYIAGFSVLVEGIRLRTSWASDLGWNSQLTYSF